MRKGNMRKATVSVCLCAALLSFGSAASPASASASPGLWEKVWGLGKRLLTMSVGHGDDVARVVRASEKLEGVAEAAATLPRKDAVRRILEALAEAGIISPSDVLRLTRVPGLDDALLTAARNGDDLKTVLQGTRKAARSVALLSASQIDDLAGLPVKQAAQAIGKLKLSQETLERTYLSILISQGKISAKAAEELFKNLKGVPGFVSTMKKASSINPAQQMGHLFELKLANEARKQGFSVLGIGTKFRDFAKKGLTDMDLLLERGGRKVFIEAKNYPDVDWVSLPLFRRDMESLVHAKEVFGQAERCFIISNLPSNPNIVAALKAAAEKNGVKLVFGSAESAVSQVF